MEKAELKKLQWGILLTIIVQIFLLNEFFAKNMIINNNEKLKRFPPIRLHKLGHDHEIKLQVHGNPRNRVVVMNHCGFLQVVMDNGLVNVTLSTPKGMVTRIQYGGIDNILEYNKESNRGYWDIIWNRRGYRLLDRLDGTSYRVIKEDENQVEISFPSTWDPSLGDSGRPLNIDKRFIMMRGSSGFYTYAIFERLEGWPAMNIDEGRLVFKLHHKLFNFMAISDTRQRVMPTPYDRIRGQQLDYKEAVLLTNPYNEDLKGEVDDKYQYSADIKDNLVHGWICFDPTVGFWVITPSNEFRVGGSLKQELTSHVGPTSLAMFFSSHYAGKLSLAFQDGEPWKKVFGPFFIYLNNASADESDPVGNLWKDAKHQMLKETERWPYNFPLSEDFPKANQRGTVTGRLLVRDRYINKELINTSSAHVGLAGPGEVRSWQKEIKGYQFWTQADAEGYFKIKNVRAGNYSLYAWVPGIIGDYRCDALVRVTPGSEIRLGVLVYYPPRIGPTLWEIGTPDRTAAEFYVPDPNPNRINHLFLDRAKTEKFRQYGLWDRYSELYPDHDLVYTVGTSSYQKDWFFAHVNRKTKDNTYVPTTWTILFDLKYVMRGPYTLHLALASSSMAELQVRINNPFGSRPHFTTKLIGRDNAVARHGIHGLYTLYTVNISSFQLINGSNAIYLTQSRGGSPFQGLMYDYIRLERPPGTIQ